MRSRSELASARGAFFTGPTKAAPEDDDPAPPEGRAKPERFTKRYAVFPPSLEPARFSPYPPTCCQRGACGSPREPPSLRGATQRPATAVLKSALTTHVLSAPWLRPQPPQRRWRPSPLPPGRRRAQGCAVRPPA